MSLHKALGNKIAQAGFRTFENQAEKRAVGFSSPLTNVLGAVGIASVLAGNILSGNLLTLLNAELEPTLEETIPADLPEAS